MKNQSAAVGRRLSDPEFSQKLLRRSFLTNTVLGGAIVALVGDRIWRDHHPPRPQFFYTNGRDTPREVRGGRLRRGTVSLWISGASADCYGVVPLAGRCAGRA